MIDDAKQNYYSRLANNLPNVQRNSKLYWSIISNIFFKQKESTHYFPFISWKWICPRYYKETWNSFFAEQWSLQSNDSKLPSRLHYFTKKILSTIKSLSNIFDIIQLLDPNKAHSHDMIIIRILKICGKSICRPFELIFNECISKKKLFNDRNKSRVNDKRSFIGNPYLFKATLFVYNYTHFKPISVTTFS